MQPTKPTEARLRMAKVPVSNLQNLQKAQRVCVCAGLLALTACTSMTPVQPVGRDRFMIGSTVRGGFTTDGQVKSEVLQRARDFCGKKEMVLESSTSGGTQGWTPQTAEVLFKCD